MSVFGCFATKNKDAIKRNGETSGESKSNEGRGESNPPTSETNRVDKGVVREVLRDNSRGSNRSDGVDSERNVPVTFEKTDDYQAFTDAISEIKKTPVDCHNERFRLLCHLTYV